MRFQLLATIILTQYSSFSHGAEKIVKYDKLLEYEEVTVTSVKPSYIRIMHKNGMTSIPIEKLSKDVRENLGLTLDSADTYRKKISNRLNEQRKMAIRKAKIEKVFAKYQYSASGTILQVVNGGLLVRDVYLKKTIPIITKEEKKIPYKVQTGGPTKLSPRRPRTIYTRYRYEWVEVKDYGAFTIPLLFIRCETSKYVVDDKFTEEVYEDDTFSYTTILGAAKTITAYTTDASKVLERYGLNQ